MLQVTPIRIRVGVRMTVSKSIVKDPEKNVWDHVIYIGPEVTLKIHLLHI